MHPLGDIRRPAVGRVLASVAVVLAVSAALGGEIDRAVSTTNSLNSQSIRAGSLSSLAQTYCWSAEVRHQVPAGAAVYVGAGTYDSQRLAEAVTLWARPVSSATAAQWLLSLQNSASGCEGLAITAMKR